MVVRKAYTKEMLNWWVKNKHANANKFKGVSQESNKFYYTDEKGTKREIIPLEDQEEFIINKYKDKDYGLTSLGKFYSKIATDYSGISREKIASVLEKIPVYQQFKPVKHLHSTTKPIITNRPYERFQIDLMDMSKLSRYNKGYKWILSVVDLFTKKAWVIPLKDKTAANVWTGLKSLLDSLPEKPHIIQSDNGNEFKGPVSEGLDALQIKQIFSSTYHPQSQGAVEAFNGTFKRLLRRYFAENENKNWVDELDSIMTNYNNSIHSTTKHKPNEVIDAYENKDSDDNEKSRDKLRDVTDNIHTAAKRSSSYISSFKDDIAVDDYVRIALETTADLMKNKLSKRNLNPTYSKEIYRVIKVIKPRESKQTSIKPIKYRLVDHNNTPVDGLFYRLRLLKTAPPDQQVGKPAINHDKDLDRDDEEEEEEIVSDKPLPNELLSNEPAKKQKKKEIPVEPLRRSTRERKRNTRYDD